jgi:dTDP-4-amino-4,6-dideoxygalactose transaminase
MSATFIPFAVPDIGDEEIAEVVDSLRSGWITTGPKTKLFESEFCKFLGEGLEAVAVNSATAGLHLALEAVGVGPGDEVITTTYTFTATAEVIRYLGADPVFVDIDPSTLTIDPELVRQAISPRTKAIVPVHYAGRACRMAELLAIAHEYSVSIIEDAAHSLPATYRGELVGTLGSAACVFSFYATKPLATGEGGMLVTRNKQLAERARVMRLHGIDRDAFSRYVSKKPAWYYEIVAPGFKYNMTDLAASLGIHQLRKAWRFQERRRDIADSYDKAFQELPIDLPPRPESGDTHAWHLYPIQLLADAKVSRNKFIERMGDLGVACSVHYIPLHLHPYWRDRYGLTPTQFPNAQQKFEGTVSLPIYSKMTNKDSEYVVGAVREALGE